MSRLKEKIFFPEESGTVSQPVARLKPADQLETVPKAKPPVETGGDANKLFRLIVT